MTYLKLISKKRYIVDWVDKGCPQQPTTGHPTTNRAQSNLFKLPRCEGGNRKVTFRASIHTAYRDRKIKENPNDFLERIETIPTDKEHLSQDEVIRLASTPCSAPALKRAFLFSCLTALRKSDIKKLTWEEIQPYGSDGVMYVTTRMQKTKDIVHNPISEEALELIGYSPDKRGKVFPDFKDSMTQVPLKNWLKEGCMDSSKGSRGVQILYLTLTNIFQFILVYIDRATVHVFDVDFC